MAIEKVELTSKFKKTAASGGTYIVIAGSTTVSG